MGSFTFNLECDSNMLLRVVSSSCFTGLRVHLASQVVAVCLTLPKTQSQLPDTKQRFVQREGCVGLIHLLVRTFQLNLSQIQ